MFTGVQASIFMFGPFRELSGSSVMGVRGLQGFVGSTCPHIRTVVDFRELAERHRNQHPGSTPTVVVDAMCCLRYWYTPESWVCGGQWREYFSALRDFVKTFTNVGIKLVFFFDGTVEQEKREEWVKRRLKNNREISRIFHYIKSHREQPGRNMFFIPSGLAIFTRFALKTLGQETLCSLQEADYEVASYGLQNNCLGILGEDTDYLVYDTCPYFSIGDLCLESLSTIMLCREKLCESLALSLADLPLLACLLGNDIIPEGMFESFRYKCLSSYTSLKENFDKKGNIILAVAYHISKVLHLHQGEKKLEEMLPLGPNKALFYKGVASYLLPGQKSPWFFQKPKGLITLHKQVVSMSSDPEPKQGIPMCVDPEPKDGVPMCVDPEPKDRVPMCADPEPKQGVPMCADPEPKQGGPMGADPDPKQGVPMCVDPEPKDGVPMCADPEPKQGVPMCVDPDPKQGVPMCADPEPKQGVPMCADPEPKQGVPMCADPEPKQGVPMCADPEPKQGVPMCADPEPKQGVPMCADPEPKQGVPICIDPESRQGFPIYAHSAIKQKLPLGADPEFKLEAPMCTDPAIKQDRVHMEPEVKQVTMVSDPEILKVARAHHVQAESYLVYNIMSSGEIECSNTLEDALDQALPSQAFVYRPVRQRVYALLLGDGRDGAGPCPTVKEWFVYSGNPLRHPDLVRPLQMNIPGGTPNLKSLWLNQEPGVQGRRLDALLGCFDLSSSREELQAVENPFQALCCLLIHLFVQVDTLCLEDLHAFIAQALCLQGKSTVQLVDLQLDYVDPRAVQLGSLLVRGLTTLVLVNSACGFPWRTSDFMPWNVFDGKLFHQKYLQAEKGHSVEALVEQNRSRLTKFHALKSVVCKACVKENRRIVSRQHGRSQQPGRWGRPGSGSHRTSSGYSRAGHGQHWRDQGAGNRQYEPDHWRRYSSSSGFRGRVR
ncbi:constitutive coactivator of peroxisome proliferator-activated receptor gamma isoform X1 [Meles meles]|uniref:constitutive coactivator of peroxisome proliferator-activated receptor gamma isoform X1 n=3 Tax=Meles meles TaxID=9662 RepID=UPI001E69D8C7|nr:constitutive coactivator of peroxisome proliferator-activated receptor gamma isoform X1 [Meles meles]XP_045861217.1 constitutive coactivator of peroxisome proliferator-activated receptor gamma isoform X1 [Meles meles]